MTISINQPVPDMSFDVYHKGTFSKMTFSDFKDKWLVVMFYPADFTFVCPTELKEAAARYEDVKKLGADILSVSCDSKYTHMAWHESSPAIKTVTYPMAADPTGNIAKAFGVYIEEKGQSLRGTFIVSPKGILKAMDIHDNSIGRSISEIIRKLQASIYVSKHTDEVCPASWTPGDKTLTESDDLVGKI
jgi:peroxiredoxin (alkyl hydroperoxide reductase subunit C)